MNKHKWAPLDGTHHNSVAQKHRIVHLMTRVSSAWCDDTLTLNEPSAMTEEYAKQYDYSLCQRCLKIRGGK